MIYFAIIFACGLVANAVIMLVAPGILVWRDTWCGRHRPFQPAFRPRRWLRLPNRRYRPRGGGSLVRPAPGRRRSRARRFSPRMHWSIWESRWADTRTAATGLRDLTTIYLPALAALWLSHPRAFHKKAGPPALLGTLMHRPGRGFRTSLRL